MILDRGGIDQYLHNNYRKMKDPEFFFGVDNNQDTVEDYLNADLRILTVYLTPGKMRGFSSTEYAIDQLIQKKSNNVFSDICYIPYRRTADILKKDEIPWLFGNVSHAPYTDYDLIFISLSILPEIVNYPHMLYNSNIPLSYEERFLNENIPPIVLGGAASLTSFILYGKTKNGRSLVDFSFFGYGEGIVDNLVKESEEFNIRSNIKQNKGKYYDYLIESSSVRDYIYFPLVYKFYYDRENIKIIEMEKLDDRLPDKVKIMNGKKEFVNFSDKIFNLDGSGSTRHNIPISRGCTGSGGCAFCLEGQVSGGYREKNINTLKQDMRKIKRETAVNHIGFYSYNTNYYSRYIDLLNEFAKNFNNLSLNTMRADVMAEREDYLRLGRKLGLRKVAMAVEGMGDRVRNKILNKNLSKKQIRKAVKNIFKQGFSSLKINLIITGWETEDDIQEWLEELDMILKEKKKMKAGTSIRLVHTSLIIYHQTPLRWMPRDTARLSLYKIKTMSNYMEELKKRDVRIRFHGRNYKYYFEQLLLDLGILGTEFLIDQTKNYGVRYDKDYVNLRKDNILKSLEKIKVNKDSIFRKREIDEIFPTDVVKFVPEKRLNNWKEMHKRQDFRKSICLKTPANRYPKCDNCGYCKSKKEVEWTINREISNINSIDDVLVELSYNQFKSASRVVLKQDPKWRFYDRRNLSKYITSLFLRESEYLLDLFYEVGGNTLKWVSINDQKGWASGRWAFDIRWKKDLEEEKIKKYINIINNKIQSAEIINIYLGVEDIPIKINQYISWLGVVNKYSLYSIKNKINSNFDWNVKVAEQVSGIELKLGRKKLSKLKDNMLFMPYNDGFLVYMVLRLDVNPYLVLATLLEEPYKNIIRDVKFKVLEHGKKVDINCDCGRELYYSLFDAEVKNECQICKGKKLLYAIEERKRYE